MKPQDVANMCSDLGFVKGALNGLMAGIVDDSKEEVIKDCLLIINALHVSLMDELLSIPANAPYPIKTQLSPDAR